MKYFTADWYSGNLSDQECNRLRDAYWEYVDSIYYQLPFGLKILAKHINLHDAIVAQFYYNPKERTIFMQIFGGDLQIGYFSLECTYSGVIKYWSSQEKNKNPIHMEILSDEIELLDKETFSQKFLFVGDNEMEITFKKMAISISTISEKDYLQLPVLRQPA